MSTTEAPAPNDQKLDTSRLKKFAQTARRLLLEQVESKLKRVLADGSLARRESAKAIAELESMTPRNSQWLPTGEEIPEKHPVYRWAKKYWFNDFGAYDELAAKAEKVS